MWYTFVRLYGLRKANLRESQLQLAANGLPAFKPFECVWRRSKLVFNTHINGRLEPIHK